MQRDRAAFVLAGGRRIFVKRQDDMTAHALLHALRMIACGYFTTVLGPGTDAAHEATSTSTLICMARRRTTASANEQMDRLCRWAEGQHQRQRSRASGSAVYAAFTPGGLVLSIALK
jgi:hypothetical protein